MIICLQDYQQKELQFYLIIYISTGLHSYKSTKITFFKKQKKNEQKKRRRDRMRYSITQLLPLENSSYNTVNLYQIMETKYILP